MSTIVQRPLALAKPTSIRWTRIASTLAIAWVVGMIDKIAVGIISANKVFLAQTGLTGHLANIGLLTSTMLFAYALAFPLWGHFVNRIGVRRTFVIGLVMWCIAMAGFAAGNSFGVLLIFRILLGLGEAVLYIVCNAYVYSWFPDYERGRASGIWMIGLEAGVGLAGYFVSLMLNLFHSWRAPFIGLAVITLIVTIPMAIWLTRNSPQEHPAVNSEERALIAGTGLQPASGSQNEAADFGHDQDTGYEFIKDYKFWMNTLAAVGNGVCYWAWAAWMPTYIVAIRKGSFATYGTLSVVGAAIAIIGIFAGSYLADKTGKRSPFGAMGFLVAAVLLFIGVRMHSLGVSIAVLAFAYGIQQIGLTTTQPVLQRLVNQRTVGKAAGIMNLLSNIIPAIAPLVVGVLIARGGFLAAFDLMVISLLVAAASLGILVPQRI